MKRYGLLVTITETKTGKTLKVYKPVCSDSLNYLKKKQKKILEEVIQVETTVYVDIFDYQECRYVK